MAEKILSSERLVAGYDYLGALQKLGLHPEGLFWAFDDAVDEAALVLVTSFYDQVGPLELNKLLFRAYNLAATPKSISPFIVRLHSPKDDVAMFIGRFVKEWGGPGLMVRTPGDLRPGWQVQAASLPDPLPVGTISIADTSLHAFANGLYVWRKPPRAGQPDRSWAHIKHSVDELEAA